MTIEEWFTHNGYQASAAQRQVWRQYAAGNNGLLIAPTGAGKTYAAMGAIIKQAQKTARTGGQLRVLWITPLRALAADTQQALTVLCSDTLPGWRVKLRTGDSSSSLKQRHRKKLPEVLITTPESLHVMLSYPGAQQLFDDIDCVVVDEWHSLLGSKRGVMLQLALAWLSRLSSDMRVWGMSATIGNPEVALEALVSAQPRPAVVITDKRPKKITVDTIIPAQVERFPWAGHMGDALLPEILTVIKQRRSTLLFTNTRNQAEQWYRKLLAADAGLAGKLALHHGSLATGQRAWVEAALHDGRLRAVVATSSLDLGVDFRPVDTVIQLGGPKDVARFMQRAGRSGHTPGEVSQVYFAPTNTLELFEAAALQQAVKRRIVEPIMPLRGSFDVLAQWLVTLGCGDGFVAEDMHKTVLATAAFSKIKVTDWQWLLRFVTTGGPALKSYDNYRKLARRRGRYEAREKDIVRRHRLAIGAITATASIPIKVLRGSTLGSIEESFAGGLTPGQIFWFSGRPLTFVRMRDNTVWVRAATTRRGITPAWAGGRLPFSSQLAGLLRSEIDQAAHGKYAGRELRAIRPLVALQAAWSAVPRQQQLLVEQFKSRDGYHLLVYPFEGRATHETLAMLLAQRLGIEPNTFSLAANDYGFEILAAKPLVITAQTLHGLLSIQNLQGDLQRAIEGGSLPRRQFRSIAVIAGLINSGTPGKPQSNRHLQASSETVYDVLRQYDPDNLLLRQAYDEVMESVVDISRVQATLQRLGAAEMLLTKPPHPTPFAFPLMSERLRERLSTEQLADRLARLQARLERYAADI